MQYLKCNTVPPCMCRGPQLWNVYQTGIMPTYLCKAEGTKKIVECNYPVQCAKTSYLSIFSLSDRFHSF